MEYSKLLLMRSTRNIPSPVLSYLRALPAHTKGKTKIQGQSPKR